MKATAEDLLKVAQEAKNKIYEMIGMCSDVPGSQEILSFARNGLSEISNATYEAKRLSSESDNPSPRGTR